jgi:hypothetical protein
MTTKRAPAVWREFLFLLLLTTLRTEVRTSALALWAGYPVLAIRLHTPRRRAANGNPWRTAMGRGALVVRPEACRHIRFSRTTRARFYIYIRHIRRLSPVRGAEGIASITNPGVVHAGSRQRLRRYSGIWGSGKATAQRNTPEPFRREGFVKALSW